MSSTPKRLGKYELLERLGHGGVAEVWKAFDTQLQRFVAIKLLHPDLRDDPNFIQRFKREAQLIASLHHPNIVQIHDFQIYQPSEEEKTEEEGSPIAYMVMDYVDGQTLATYIQNTSSKRAFPSSGEIVNLFTSISLAIDFAHKKGMIHRDIKPANILLDQRNKAHNSMGEPILTDFGIARLLSATSNTLSGTMLGTPLYISPEQAQGYPGNERSDLYSLGVILYEIVTGTPPFRGDTAIEVINLHANATPTAPELINPAVSPALSAVLQRSLAKDPAARFPNAAALAIAIAEAFQLPIPENLAQPGYPSDSGETPTVFQSLPTSNAAVSAGGVPVRSGPPSQPGFSGPPSQPGYSGPISQPGISRPISQPGYATPSQPGYSGPISQPGYATPSQPGFSGPISQPGYATPSQPGFTPIIVHPAPAAPAPVQPPLPSKKARPLWPYILLVAGVLVALIAGGMGAFRYLPTLNSPHPVAANPVVGKAFYLSSGQITPTSAQGIADQLQVDLQNIPAPRPGNSYALWLLGDKIPEPGADLLGGVSTRPVKPPLLLTNNLPVVNGTVHYHYQGDAQHNNLISATSRLLITEGASGTTPGQPPTDRNTWRYYAEIPQGQLPPPAGAGFSALVHIRHLFYNETNIKALGLPGGLDHWIFKNTEKLLELSVSARDDWHGQATSPSDVRLIHDLLVRSIDYLDGTANVNKDVPRGTPLLVGTDARVGLITVDLTYQNNNLDTDPPGYVDHIQLHVGQVAKAPDISPQMRDTSGRILDTINNAKNWLLALRKDDLELIKIMNDPNAMKQASVGAILDDMVTQATYAYIGQMDPVTSKVKGGVLQAHYAIQQLASYSVTTKLPQSL